MSFLWKLPWPQVAALVEQGAAAILPVGSTEAHGPHLPLDTDVSIALGMSIRAMGRLTAAGRPCVVLPPVVYSVTDFAGAFAGSLGVRKETATALLTDVLTGAVRTGFRPVAVANAHLEPAHLETIRAAIAAVKEATGVDVLFPDVTRRRLAERLTDEFRSGACHAGRYETSLVMADDPRFVDDVVRKALPPVPISLVDAIRAGLTDFLQAGGEQAYFGAPAEASAEEGEATFDVLAELLVEAVEGAGR
ncbi:MAG: creatininase family protein [Planctomycetes bacterium]|nr:creatininase family protein [Planctomycetota bacterium]